MFAIEESTSSAWAREMRGTASMASTVIFRLPSSARSSGLRPGAISEISVAPSANLAISAVVGALILATTGAPQACAVSTIVAPAASKSASG